MSKYSEEFCNQYGTVGKVREETKRILKNGGDLAFKEIHSAKSFRRLKEKIRRC